MESQETAQTLEQPLPEEDTDIEEVDSEEEEEITIIEISDTEIRDESGDEEEDGMDDVVDFDPTQLGIIVTEAELPDDLLGEPVNGIFRCKFCPQKHESKSSLISHVQRHISNGSIRKCRFCDFFSAMKQKLQEHEWRHTREKPYQCDVCQFCCGCKTDLIKHQMIHSSYKRYQCKVCGHRTRTNANLRRHMERHDPNMPRNFACVLCGFAFKRESALKMHVQRRHNDSKPLSCDQCPFRCKTAWELNSHKAKHSDDRPYPCMWPDCDKSYKTKSDCTKHMKRHTGVKNFECSVCGKTFFDSNLLRAHVITHSDVRKFECGQCMKKFKTLRSLQSHIITHQAVKPFRCEVCFKTYSSQSNLDMHRRVHEEGRPYQCPICVHGSREMDHLLVHVGSEHLHNFTYLCGLCRKPFGKSAQLQLHIQRCHKDSMKDKEEVMVYDPVYLDQNLQPHCTGAFNPTIFAKHLAQETAEAEISDQIKQENEVNITEGNGMESNVSDQCVDEKPVTQPAFQLPPALQLAKFGGVPFCLVRRNSGVHLNCQKTGKKPKYWFMDTSMMTKGDAERYEDYLKKKEAGLLPQQKHRPVKRKKQARSMSRPGKANSAGESNPFHKGKGQRGRSKTGQRKRRRICKQEVYDTDEEEAYHQAQCLMLEWEGGQAGGIGETAPARISSRPRKQAVHFKNIPPEMLSPSHKATPTKRPLSTKGLTAQGKGHHARSGSAARAKSSLPACSGSKRVDRNAHNKSSGSKAANRNAAGNKSSLSACSGSKAANRNAAGNKSSLFACSGSKAANRKLKLKTALKKNQMNFKTQKPGLKKHSQKSCHPDVKCSIKQKKHKTEAVKCRNKRKKGDAQSLSGSLLVSHYSFHKAAANTQCWQKAMFGTADTIRSVPTLLRHWRKDSAHTCQRERKGCDYTQEVSSTAVQGQECIPMESLQDTSAHTLVEYLLETSANIPVESGLDTSADIPVENLLGASANIPGESLLEGSASIPGESLLEGSANIPGESLLEGSANIPGESPLDTSPSIPVESVSDVPVNNPAESLSDTLVNNPAESLSDTLVNSPGESLSDTPVNNPADSMSDTPVNNPAESLSDTPVNNPADSLSDTLVNNPAESLSDTPVNNTAESLSDAMSVNNPAESISDATPVNNPAESLSDTPVNNPAESLSDAMSVNNPAESLSDATPVNNPAESLSDTTPVNNPAESLSDAMSVNNPAESLSNETPVNNPAECLSDAMSVNNPAESLSDATPVNNPAECLSDATPVNNPAECLSDATPVNNPAEFLSDATPVNNPAECLSDATPVNNPAESLSDTPVNSVEMSDASINNPEAGKICVSPIPDTILKTTASPTAHKGPAEMEDGVCSSGLPPHVPGTGEMCGGREDTPDEECTRCTEGKCFSPVLNPVSGERCEHSTTPCIHSCRQAGDCRSSGSVKDTWLFSQAALNQDGNICAKRSRGTEQSQRMRTNTAENSGGITSLSFLTTDEIRQKAASASLQCKADDRDNIPVCNVSEFCLGLQNDSSAASLRKGDAHPTNCCHVLIVDVQRTPYSAAFLSSVGVRTVTWDCCSTSQLAGKPKKLQPPKKRKDGVTKSATLSTSQNSEVKADKSRQLLPQNVNRKRPKNDGSGHVSKKQVVNLNVDTKSVTCTRWEAKELGMSGMLLATAAASKQKKSPTKTKQRAGISKDRSSSKPMAVKHDIAMKNMAGMKLDFLLSKTFSTNTKSAPVGGSKKSKGGRKQDSQRVKQGQKTNVQDVESSKQCPQFTHLPHVALDQLDMCSAENLTIKLEPVDSFDLPIPTVESSRQGSTETVCMPAHISSISISDVPPDHSVNRHEISALAADELHCPVEKQSTRTSSTLLSDCDESHAEMASKSLAVSSKGLVCPPLLGAADKNIQDLSNASKSKELSEQEQKVPLNHGFPTEHLSSAGLQTYGSEENLEGSGRRKMCSNPVLVTHSGVAVVMETVPAQHEEMLPVGINEFAAHQRPANKHEDVNSKSSSSKTLQKKTKRKAMPRQQRVSGECRTQDRGGTSQTGVRSMNVAQAKQQGPVKHARSAPVRSKAKTTVKKTDMTAAASAIVSKSRNQPAKRMRSLPLQSADRRGTRKRKRYMYVETDMGDQPDPPVKKRGRRPGPKIVMDRSQTNLCFEPENLLDTLPADGMGLGATGPEEDPFLRGDVALQSSPSTAVCLVSEQTECEDNVLPQMAVPMKNWNHPPSVLEDTAFFQSAPSALRADVGALPISTLPYSTSDAGCVLETPVLSEGGSPALLENKPVLEETLLVAVPPATHQSGGDFSSSAESFTREQSEQSRLSCVKSCEDDHARATLLEVLTSHLENPENTASPSLVSSHHSELSLECRTKPAFDTQLKTHRKKQTDHLFWIARKRRGRADPDNLRRSERSRKLRLTEEQMRLAQDSSDSDQEDEDGSMALESRLVHSVNTGEDAAGSDVEFVTADYSSVDLSNQQLSLQTLRGDLIPTEQGAIQGGRPEFGTERKEKDSFKVPFSAEPAPGDLRAVQDLKIPNISVQLAAENHSLPFASEPESCSGEKGDPQIDVSGVNSMTQTGCPQATAGDPTSAPIDSQVSVVKSEVWTGETPCWRTMKSVEHGTEKQCTCLNHNKPPWEQPAIKVEEIKAELASLKVLVNPPGPQTVVVPMPAQGELEAVRDKAGQPSSPRGCMREETQMPGSDTLSLLGSQLTNRVDVPVQTVSGSSTVGSPSLTIFVRTREGDTVLLTDDALNLD